MSRSSRDPAERAVAVVGVGAILPDALDAKAFWQNVVQGRNSISEVTPDRWSAADYFDTDPKAPGKTYSKIGGWVRGTQFEPTKFRIPPTISAAMDDGQKWALLCASEALRDAGHPDRPLNTESTAVILGNAMGGELHYLTCLRLSMPEYVHAIEDTQVFQSLSPSQKAAMVEQLRVSVGRRFPDTTEDTMPGELTNITAGRVAGVLNMRGPNFTTDAACASSLAALQAAVDGLVDRHYDVAITGAMDRNMGATTFIKFSKIGALSPDGSRPYDKGANGFVMGEGGAFFICKRLEDAEKAGDRIYAVVRGVGGSSDGKGKGITAPNPVGQILAIRRAWRRAGLDPATMTLLEGHGTSTRAGDVAETESLAQALSEVGPIKHRIAVGSIKSQIGHLKSAAGAAGLLKAVLACHHKILPPSINFNEPNPNIPWDKLPLDVNTQARPWEKPSFGPRRCGLSSFGFGGTNFHVVIEEHVPGMLTRREPVVQVPASYDGPSAGSGVVASVQDNRPQMLGNMLAVGGVDAGAVRVNLQQALAKAKAGQAPDRTPPGRDFLAAPARMVIAFDDAAELVKKCETALNALDKNEAKKWRVLQSKGIYFRSGPAGKIAFLFPGQGSQYVNMLADVPDPIVRETFAEADRVMAPILGKPLTEYVYKNEADSAAMAAAEEALKDTTICQPAMVASDISIMRLLDKHGVKPDIVMGHSLGEWAAAVGAGMVTFPEALVAVSARARAMASVSIGDKGKMASVMGPTDEIVRCLPEIGGYLTPANINSRKQTVIAGASDAVDRAVAYFNQRGMTAQIIPVSHAFHSKVVAPASDALYRTICEMQIAFPRIPLVGNIDGQLYPTDNMETIKRRLADQMASSVQFVKGVETCYREGARLFVEVGPKRALMALAESILEDKDDVVCFSTNHPKRGGVRSFHDAMCGFYAAGVPRPEQLVAALSAAQGEVRVAPAPSVPAPIVLNSNSQGAIMSDSPIRTSTGQPDYEGLGKLFARFLDEGMAMVGGRRGGATPAPESRSGSVVVSGAALGLPGQNKHVFDDSNADRILRGESFIDPVPSVFRARMVEKNVVRLHKREVGEPSLDAIKSVDEVIRLAARRGAFDIVEEFGIPRERVEAWDITTALAVAAGIEALRDAGIPLVRHYRRTTTGSFLPDRWRVPQAMADETGVIFASAFPGFDNLLDEVSRFYASQRNGHSNFTFDRRFLFRVLAMGHSQFAELLGIRGPNTQVNAACASTTMAVGMAEDWIRAGRCRRVLVIGADDVTSDNLLEWMGAGFLATGAASTEQDVGKAALPFDRRRNGMLIGMGACGLVVESEDSLRERGMRGLCEVLGSEFANSAFHGTRLDVSHIEDVMERLVSGVERRHGLDRHQMARELVFISHETYTPARGGSAAAEVFALRKTFGSTANDLVVSNTKGFTGHPMGVGIEDAIAVRILEKQVVPPVPNYREPDPELGTLNLSRGGHYPVRYALRLAAGFGSQIAMTVLRRIDGLEERVADRALYQRWLSEISGYPSPVLEVEKRTLRIRDMGAPAREPAQSTWTMGTGPRASLAAAPTPAAPAPVAPVPVVRAPAPAPAPEAAPAPVEAKPAGDAVMEQVLKLVSDKTGYPRDMLEPDLDLEADLGIDTVKQAEVFGLVRETFNIPRQDTLKLRDYPTLRHVVGFVKQNRPELAGDASAAPAPSPVAAAPAAAAPVAVVNAVAEKVMSLVAEKTGYPRDMLELDLDLEADLGIDTVKQAEVFALVRETFNIARQDTLKLRDYPTLRHVIGFVESNRPDLASVAAPAALVPSVPVAAPAAASAPPATAPAGGVVAEKVLAVVAEKTGYPRDMLELDLDLEADLGIDTVKQAEVFALVRETFDIPRQDTLKLRDYPTLRHVIGFVESNRPDLATTAAPAPAPAPVAVATAPVAAAPVAAAPASTGGPVADKVLEVVAEKTGYPRDMLELDLDLEADLGIDTVKQAEVFALVRESFSIPRQDNVKLRDYPTLRHVIGFVESNRPDLAGAAPAVPAPVAPAPVHETPATPATSGDPIEDKVLELVAGKTGYPRDMLEMDLDLEADLGIDTVKQAEVFALVRESFNIPRQDDVKLRDYPTLRHVIGFVRKYMPASATPATPVTASAAPAAVAPSATPTIVVSEQSPFESGVLRRPFISVRPPLAACKSTGVRLEKGNRVVVVADNEGAGKLLCEQLEGRGVQVLRIDARPERAEIEAALRQWAQAGNVSGLFFLPALDGYAALSDIDLVEFRKLYRDRVLLLHGAARGLYDALNPGTFFITATRMGGQHGYGAAGAINSLGGAVTGFTKTVRRERPDILGKVVDFEDGATPEMIAAALLDEAERDPGAVEVGYSHGLRVTVSLDLMQATPADVRTPLTLDETTVFAVTGGAGAITVAIVRDLAAASRGTFYLLDARAMPPESEHALLNLVVKDREAAKREVFERMKAEKGRATPAQVEEKLFDLERQAGILEALRSVEAAGGRAFYRQVDVLDGNTVKTVMDGIREQSGKLDVILHAAGLERSRSLDRKPVEEFDLVFRVKADGLFNLLAATRDMDVKAVVGFSSVAGRFGNAGQADYASGNDFMCKTLSWWSSAKEGRLGIALDWTAWGGIGMATRGSIPEIMKRAGIDMLDPAEGLPVIRRALQAGYCGEAVVGRRLGILMEPFDKDGGIDPNGSLQARAQEKALPLPFDKVAFDLHRGLSAEIRLDPKVEPFLYDHAIDGIPVLPGVMGLETFAEAAWLLAPQCRVSSLESVRFLAPMKYYRHEPRSVIVRAKPVLSPDGRIRVAMTLSSVQAIVGREPEEKLHFSGAVVLEQGAVEGVQTSVDGSGPVGGIGFDDIYRVYFHGPAYRVLEMVNRLSSGQVVGTMRSPLPADTTNPQSTSMVGPRMIELGFQTAGVWEIGQTGQMGLPSVVDKVTVFEPAINGETIVAELSPKSTQDSLSFDIKLRDGSGKVYLTVEGYRTSRIPGGLPDEALERFRGVIG